MRKRLLCRAALLATAAAVLCWPGAASAHVGGKQILDEGFYRSTVQSVSPTVPGLAVREDPFGQWVEVTNTSASPVLVLGYSAEPYLKITRTGTWENLRSVATYLNASPAGDATKAGPPGATPVWRRISATGTARWHDHRLHWMNNTPPPQVVADPARPHELFAWQFKLVAGSTPVTVQGQLTWIGKPAAASSGVPGWALPAGAVGLALLAGLGGGLALSQRGRSADEPLVRDDAHHEDVPATVGG